MQTQFAVQHQTLDLLTPASNGWEKRQNHSRSTGFQHNNSYSAMNELGPDQGSIELSAMCARWWPKGSKGMPTLPDLIVSLERVCLANKPGACRMSVCTHQIHANYSDDVGR